MGSATMRARALARLTILDMKLDCRALYRVLAFVCLSVILQM